MPPKESGYDFDRPFGAWCEMDKGRLDEFSAQVAMLKRMKKDKTGCSEAAFTALRVLRPSRGDDPIFQADAELNDMIETLDNCNKLSDNGFQNLLNMFEQHQGQQ